MSAWPASLAMLLALVFGGSAAADDATEAAPLQAWALPSATQHAAQPVLASAADGGLYLGWIHRIDEGSHRLQVAHADADGVFGAVHTAAEGSGWFVNWADTPDLLAHGDGQLDSYLLLKSGARPFAYDLALLRSADGGRSWTAPTLVHDDGTETEHGFGALWAEPGGRVGIAWLDGRETAAAQGHAHGHGGGAMTLRAAVFGADGKEREWLLDELTCDCCPTAAARTGSGLVLVYRGRTPDEVRDILLLRKDDGSNDWSAPAPVHADGWKTPGCPVNGPEVAASGQRVAVAWYTEAAGQPELRLAQSADGGVAFGPPLQLAAGPEQLGRVGLAFAGDALYALWLEEHADGQHLQLARIEGGDMSPARTIATLAARGRASGLPRMAVAGDSLFLVWTDVVDGAPQLRGARLSLP